METRWIFQQTFPPDCNISFYDVHTSVCRLGVAIIWHALGSLAYTRTSDIPFILQPEGSRACW
jgi:hypothetical protein